MKNLVVEGLNQVIYGTPDSEASSDKNRPMILEEDASFEIDADGVPVLKRRGVRVTDAWIHQIRETDGI